MTEKEKRLIEIMDEEDIYRVEHGQKPFYSTEEDFYAMHPEYKKKQTLINSGE